MTVVFEMHLRLGGDPRAFEDFKALQHELAKLQHVACPDVDWAQVEALCTRLFEGNGAELQTVAAFILARSYRTGIAGMSEGVALLSTLTEHWRCLWPTQSSDRLELLSWLFAQLQGLLRTLDWSRASVPLLSSLELELERLEHQLTRAGQAPTVTLQALRHQASHLLQRMQAGRAPGMPMQHWPSLPAPEVMMPSVSVPVLPTRHRFAIEPRNKRRGLVLAIVASVLTMVLAGGFGWRHNVTEHRVEPAVVQPLRLDSLNLFEVGSAELVPGSTPLLLKTLVDIKARPGWLIVIAGHTDANGDPVQNLELSRARASAVRDWIKTVGDIPDSCFAVQGFAGSQPLASNEHQAGRAANRRVDIRLLPQPDDCAQRP